MVASTNLFMFNLGSKEPLVSTQGLPSAKMDLIQNEWFIQVPWGRICVLSWGSCLDPPVMLVHDVGDNAACFAPLAKLLPKKFYYIGIDLPGSGRSDRLPPGLMLTTYDLIHVIDAVAKHFRWHTFLYIGHGLGGVLGTLYNHSIPNKISKLIALDPINFIAVEPNAFAEWYHTYFTDYYKNYRLYNKPKEKGEKYSRAEAISKVMRTRGVKEDIAAVIVDRSTEPTKDRYVRNTLDLRHTLISPPPLSPAYIRSIFLQISTPTLHLISSESRDNKRFRNTAFLQDESNYPHRNYKCVTIEGSHDFHMQCPEKSVSSIKQFLVGVDLKAKL